MLLHVNLTLMPLTLAAQDSCLRNYQVIPTGRGILMTFLIQTDFVFYYAAEPAASHNTESNSLYGVQKFLTTNNISANAETLGFWALLRHGGGRSLSANQEIQTFYNQRLYSTILAS